MKRRIPRFLALVLLLFTLTTPAAAQDPIEAHIARMTLEQKVAQMFMAMLHGEVMTEVGAEFLRTYQPGAVVLFAANLGAPDQVTRLTNNFQATITGAGGPPLLIAVDQEGGVVARLTNGFTVFPAPIVMAAAGRSMASRVGGATARELAAVGITMNLAPVADLETFRENPIIFRRGFGNDPALASEAISGYVIGTQLEGVLATAKHFPGHGETRQDSHAVLQTLSLSRERLDAVELAPFRAAIDSGVSAVMVAHIHYSALQPGPAVPASLDPRVVTDVLREELGFDGLILTDALDMNAIDLEVEYREATIRAVEAGIDLLTFGPGFGLDTQIAAITAVADAVRSGRIPESRIEESVRRILQTKSAYGLLDWSPLDPSTAAERVSAVNGTALMARLFEAGVTVAYDRAGLVPIPDDQSVAVVFLATRYQIVDECGRYRDDIIWSGVGDSPSDDEIGWARAAANRADIAVVWTQDAVTNPRQQALVNAMPAEKTVAVALWSPYDWLSFPQVAAYATAYSPLRPAVPAMCAVLFGALPAQGRLAVNLSDTLPAGSRDTGE